MPDKFYVALEERSAMKPKTGKGANRDPNISLLRKAATAAVTKYGIGGVEKRRLPPKPTLPKLKCLETK